MKGFGDELGGTVVCIAPPSPYSVELADSFDGSVDVADYADGALKRNLEHKTALAIKQTERLQALRELMTQLCIAYGNGVFGKVGAPGTAEAYRGQLSELFEHYATMSDAVDESSVDEQPSVPKPPAAPPAAVPDKGQPAGSSSPAAADHRGGNG